MKAPLSRLAYVIAVLLVAGYALVALRGPKGLHALSEKRAQIRDHRPRVVRVDLENAVRRTFKAMRTP